jgi:hypothetical protein
MWRAANQERLVTSLEGVVDGGDGILLELDYCVYLAWVGHIQYMVGYERLLCGCNFGCAYIQALIDLARVG